MAKEAENKKGARGISWRIVGWGIAALLLLLPLVAMQFTDEVRWDETDFIFAAVVFGTVGAALELAVRMSRNIAYRAGAGAALAAAFLIIWANAAVGMIGDEDNTYNLLFLGVIGLALVGAVAARFRPAGMAGAMIVAAIAQLVVALGGLPTDVRGGVLSAPFAGLWLLSAALFWKAARDQRAADAVTTA
jgi:hypothetical protein